ncbi:MAG TPA: hypothetical protein VN281_16240 [Verrucomicrobiae bacterium]|jgi:hypothetical protein|nr:hypothetical protein [Verrucomicrobiae bacterium]
MFARLTLILVTLFWVTMNVLLWRSEFGPEKYAGSPFPPAVVWQKILTAPDNSSLNIIHRGAKIGYCQWSAAVGQNGAASKLLLNDDPLDALPDRPLNYRIDFEGTVMLGDPAIRVGFALNLQFDTNHVWQEFRLRLNSRPNLMELRARAAEGTIHLQTEGDGGRVERLIQSSDLLNPQALARDLDLPASLSLGVLSGLRLSSHSSTNSPFPLGLTWEARSDWITIAHTPVRAYRLQAPLLDRYHIVVIVSRVGEILRVELPDEVSFVNEQLTTL